MHTSHITLVFNSIFFMFFIKGTLASLKFFFFVVKTHIVNLIEFILVKFRFNIFMCFLPGTYFLIFMQENFVNCTVNNSIIIFIPVKVLTWYRIVPVVLSRYNFKILLTKVSQYLKFI